jgi:uncharacterized membrane protein YfcA
MIDPLYVASGFGVGLLVGMTGVGGGSLMTPLLILLFGVHPSTAVGTDLLYAAATKTGGSLVHGWSQSIHWPAVMRLASGSIPASLVTLLVLWQLELNAEAARSLVNVVLCFALILTATSLIFRRAIMDRYRQRMERLGTSTTGSATVMVGVALGVLVSISSVGAGAVGVTALLLLYPRLPMASIVGSDIAHAVPLTLVAGIGHWALGSVDWALMGVLLIGSLPGIVIGSYCAVRVPETVLRLLLATVLILVAGKLGFNELHLSTESVAAIARSATHSDWGWALRHCSLFLLRGPAAVDREIGAGDLGGIVAAQEQRKGCDLFRRHELLGRLRVEEHVLDDLLLGHVARLHGLRDLVLDQRRPDIARADAVAGDFEGRKLQRHRFCQSGDAVLGRDIGRLERRSHQRMRGSGVDDAAPAALLHAGHGGTDGMKCR